MLPTHHRTATVEAQQVFYREAGPEEAPTVLLLHGFPSRTHMFQHLIPGLADRCHVIATDHVGYGPSSMPQAGESTYTFVHLAAITAGLSEKLGISRFSVYVHDYGAPIGWCLALNPAFEVTAIISQSGNAYMESFAKRFWDDLFSYATSPGPGPDTEPGARAKFSAETTRWQYENGAEDPSPVSPDNWLHDQTCWTGRATTRCSWRSSGTTRRTSRVNRSSTSTSAPARCHCRPSGVSATRSSGRTVLTPSRAICPMPKSICSQPVISPCKRTWTP